MKKIAGSLIVVALCSATTPRPEAVEPAKSITFVGKAQPVAQLRDTHAVVVTRDGKPVFFADEKFIRAVARNPAGRVQEWRPDDSRIRLSTGPTEIWLGCDDVKDMTLACTDIMMTAGPNGAVELSSSCSDDIDEDGCSRIVVTGSVIQPAIPNCPGSALCPKP